MLEPAELCCRWSRGSFGFIQQHRQKTFSALPGGVAEGLIPGMLVRLFRIKPNAPEGFQAVRQHGISNVAQHLGLPWVLYQISIGELVETQHIALQACVRW